MLKTRATIFIYRLRPKVILLSVIMALLVSCRLEKVVDSATKRQPDWVNGIQRGFIVGYGTGTNVDCARNAAMIDVRAKIADAVVNEIRSQKELFTTEVIKDNAYSLVSTFLKEITATTGIGIVAKGVSISNARDYYYEARRDRQSGKITVTYYIQYPFSFFELNDLVNEWQSRQQGLIEQKEEVAGRLGRHATIEELIGDIHLLMQLRESLVENSGVPVESVLAGLYNSLHTVIVHVIDEGLGFVRYKLLMNGNPIRINLPPVVHSDYVRVERVYQDNNHWVVIYSDNELTKESGSRPDIHICFRYRKWELCHTHYLDPGVDVQLEPHIVFHAKQFSFWRTYVNIFECMFQINVTGLGGVTVERIILYPKKVTYNSREVLPALSINFEPGLTSANGKNLHVINVSQRLSRNNWSLTGRDRIYVQGLLFYRENITGLRYSLNFSHIEVQTDW